MRYFLNNPLRRTIVRDVAIGALLTVVGVASLLFVLIFFLAYREEKKVFDEKTIELISNLEEVISVHVWNVDEQSIRNIIDIYMQSELVAAIEVEDDLHKTYSSHKAQNINRGVISERSLRYEGKSIGKLRVITNADPIAQRTRLTMTYVVIITCIVVFAIVIAINLLLSAFIRSPLVKILAGLERISSGKYHQLLEDTPHKDINDIHEKINNMAREIAAREDRLQEHQGRLQKLNQAIIALFSARDRRSLGRAIVESACSLCHAKEAQFVFGAGVEDDSMRSRSSNVTGWLATRGGPVQFFAWAQMDQATTGYDEFQIQAKAGLVGTLRVLRDSGMDSASITLLKSLIELANSAAETQSLIRESALIGAELKLAQSVQRSMLPTKTNDLVTYYYQPAARLGGDWFGFIDSPDKKSMCVVLGDVTGHGVAQGLVTTTVKGALDAIASLQMQMNAYDFTSPSTVISIMHEVVKNIARSSDLFMTCLAARIDFENNRIEICNAGHTFPYVLSSKDNKRSVTQLLSKQQPILGSNFASNDVVFESETFDVSRDSVMVFYTDGLTDARDEANRQFGRSLLRKLSSLPEHLNIESIKTEIIRQLQSHTYGMEIDDDICVVVVAMSAEDNLVALKKSV